MKHKVGIIGVGNMGLAILQGALRSQDFIAEDFLGCSRNIDRQTHVQNMTGIDFTQSLEEIAHCEQIVLATKPQDIAAVLSRLEKYIHDNSLIVSIAAGITIKSLQQHLNGKGHIIRVMPNTPIAIGKGVSAIAIGKECTQNDITIVEKLFSSMGTTLTVKEEVFDIVSALSGSGPAYLFYFIESLIAAAVNEGLEDKVAYDLVLNTCNGAMELVKNSDQDVAQLRKMVTSPQGSTAEAIKVFDESNVFAIVQKAVKAAIMRNKELGKNS